MWSAKDDKKGDGDIVVPSWECGLNSALIESIPTHYRESFTDFRGVFEIKNISLFLQWVIVVGWRAVLIMRRSR